MDELLRLVKRRIIKVELENIGTRITRQCKICIQDVPLYKYESHEASHHGRAYANHGITQLTNGNRNRNYSSANIVRLDRARSSIRPKPSPLCRYQCQYCDKSFISPSQCRSHQNAHTELNSVKETPCSAQVQHDSVSSSAQVKHDSVSNPGPIAECSDTKDLESPSGQVTSGEAKPQTEIKVLDIKRESEIDKIEETQPVEVKLDVTPLSKLDSDEVLKEPSTEEMESTLMTSIGDEGIEFPKLISSSFLDKEMSDFGFGPLPNHAQNGNSINMDIDNSPVMEPPKLQAIGEIVTPDVKLKAIPGPPVERKPFVAPPLTNGENSSIIVAGDSRTCLHCYEEILVSDLFVHIKTHLMKGQKECALCNYRAIASGDLRDHMNKHYNIKPYKCPICGNSYGWQSGFKKHVQSHDKELKNFKCTTCKMRFQTQRERRRHELTHKNIAGPTDKKPEPGGQSDFNTQGSLSQQTMQQYVPQQQPYASYGGEMGTSYPDYQHTSAYDFGQNAYQPAHYPPQSTQLNYGSNQQQNEASWSLHNFDAVPTFTPEPQLSWNESSHGPSSSASTPSHGDMGMSDINIEPDADEAGKPFQEPEDLRESETCKTCGLDIKMPELPNHILTHLLPGQKNCRLCKYKSHTGKYLGEHYNIHYNLKPFKCPICTRGFAMQSYLRSHTQQVHEANRKYQCRFCDKRFVRPCHQKTHEKVHEGHGESLPPIQRIRTPASKSNFDSCNSDSNNSNTRPTISSLSESSGSSPSSHHHSNSPNLVALTPFGAKPEPSWTQPAPWSNNGPTYWPPTDQFTQPHPQPPPPSDKWNEFTPPQFDTATWSPASYYAPIIKSDVSWTATNNTNDHSWQNPSAQFPPPAKPAEPAWSDPPNMYRSATPPPSTNASVQDLWAELHYEELKLFPETGSTVFTADGIPMITELAGLDGPPLHNLSVPELTTIGDTSQVLTAHLANPALLHSAPGANWKPQGRASGKAKTRVTAETRHRLNQVKVGGQGQEQSEIRSVPLQQQQPSSSNIAENPEDDNFDYDDVNRRIKCQTCGEEVLATNLLVHIHAHLVPGQRTCDLCQRTYCNYVTLREHVHVHYDLRPHKCSYCQKRFNTKYSLKTHETFEHEKGGGLQCSHCQKTFAMKSDLHKHLRSHGENGMVLPRGQLKARRPTAEEQLRNEQVEDALSREWQVKLEDIGNTITKKCVFCNEEVLLRDYFEHKYAHEEPCYVCQKPVLLTEILYHGPTHIGPTMTCEICGWKAKQRSQLWEHLNGHNKQKPIRCVYCGTGFASRNSVRSHYLALHTKFRPHRCRYCDRSFVQINTLKQHEMTHFDSSCPICFEKFDLKKNLHLHMRTEHRENLCAKTSV